MKLTGKPIFPTELAPTSKVTAAESAITALDTAYKAVDKTLTDKNTTQDTAISAVKTTADKAATDIAALTTTVTNNKTTQDAAISSAIADWASDRAYRKDNIVMRNKTFFLCLKDNSGRDPLTDAAGNWGIFTPGSASDEFAPRSPNSSDVRPAGVKWWDTSFGADTPLGFVSLGKGAWAYLNQITLSRIRFYLTGQSNTYRSNMYGVKFFRSDGTRIPDGWLVWGNRSGVGGQGVGVAFSGQGSNAGYNSSGWFELEPSTSFDTSISIGKILATGIYINCHTVQFYYSNGGVKTYTGAGFGSGASEQTIANCDPALQCRFGDAISAALGETLTSIKLADPNNHDIGRISGEAFTSAWNALYQAQPAVQAQSTAALEARIAALEAKIP